MDEPNRLGSFLSGLFLDGRAIVSSALELTPSEKEQAIAILQQAHHLAAADAPGVPPDFDEDSALWSAEMLFWSCDMLTDRAATETDLPKTLIESEPKGDQPCHHWSADLVLRFLASVIQRSERIAKDDPLGITLTRVAARWPLSAPGTEIEIDSSRLAVIAGNECLRSVMVDRIIHRKDKRLSEHSLLREYLLRAVGANVHWLS